MKSYVYMFMHQYPCAHSKLYELRNRNILYLNTKIGNISVLSNFRNIFMVINKIINPTHYCHAKYVDM